MLLFKYSKFLYVLYLAIYMKKPLDSGLSGGVSNGWLILLRNTSANNQRLDILEVFRSIDNTFLF